LILAFLVFNPGDLYYLGYNKKITKFKKIIIIITQTMRFGLIVREVMLKEENNYRPIGSGDHFSGADLYDDSQLVRDVDAVLGPGDVDGQIAAADHARH